MELVQQTQHTYNYVKGVESVGSADTTATESQTLSVNAAGGVLTNDTGGDTESLAVTNVSSNGMQ